MVPTGPRAGLRFRLDPITRLAYDELDSGRWSRAFATGPNQDGKTLKFFVIPTLYRLFELKETVVAGVPSMDMLKDKWGTDLKPAILASPYRDLMPKSGAGSRDGDAVKFVFGNGAELRFMTEGGDDQSRAGYAARFLNVTEVDGFDRVGSSSREGDKFTQLEKRTLAFDNAQLLGECTVSSEDGRIWQEYTNGTESRIALKCPHCEAWVTPERQHFRGWENATTEFEAMRDGGVCCPACGTMWSNDQRIAANEDPRLLHRGQSINDKGVVDGPIPETMTFGFRWTCVNVTLTQSRMQKVAAAEWAAKRAVDEDVADTNLRQKDWALPAKPKKQDLTKLDAITIAARKLPGHGRGLVPADTLMITVGTDVGRKVCHWQAIAWRPHGTPHSLDYGAFDVMADDLGEEKAYEAAFSEFREEILDEGWQKKDGTIVRPKFVLFDARYLPQIVMEAIEDWPDTMPAMGHGATQKRIDRYVRPSGSKVTTNGHGWNEITRPDGVAFIEVNSDHWKSWLHRRLETKLGLAGAFTFYDGGDHFTVGKHYTAEKKTIVFVPGKGNVEKWEQVRSANHKLDATMLAGVAGDIAGAFDEVEAPPASEGPDAPAPIVTPSSGGFVNSFRGRY